MKLKKNINMLIVSKIIEIMFVCAFIFVSIPLWQRMNNVSNLSTALSNNGLIYTGLSVENKLNYSMYPMTTEDALNNLKASKIIVRNDSLTFEEYSVLLTISKESTLDYNCLNIAIDDLVMPLNSMDILEDEENYNFIIDTNNLKGEQKEYLVKIWMDENTGNEMQGKSLILSFELVKSITKI